MHLCKLFISTFFFCFFVDMLWLAFIAKSIYDQQIGLLLRKSGDALSPQWGSALVVYIAITAGIILFVLPKTQDKPLNALLYGALFGAVMYGIYDFTNHAILAKWTLKITLIDFCWGIFLCAVCSYFCLAMKKVFV